MNVLLVEPDESRGKRLCAALEARGSFLRHTPDPFYALTLAERAEIDMVFVSARIEAIGVGEFVQILTEDPALANIKVAVYGVEDMPSGTVLPPMTVTLASRTDSEVVASIAARITTRPSPEKVAAEKMTKAANERAIAMIGVFEMTTLPGLLQMVCATDDQGTIQVRTPQGFGRIGYSPGLVRLVEYRDLEGVPAMAQLMSDVEDHPNSQFRVAKSEVESQQSIGVRPAELLLEVAVLQDDLRRDDQRAGGSVS